MHSLRVKLIAPFIAGTLALTLLLAWYTYSSARRAVADAILLISEAKTNQALSSMSLLFKSVSTSLQSMVVDPHVTALFEPGKHNGDVRDRTSEWLEIVVHGNEYYRDIQILDTAGVCIASSNPSYVGNNYADKKYVTQALSGRFNLDDLTVGRVTKSFNAVMAGPVDVGGRVVGALVIINDFPRIVDYESTSAHDSNTIFTALLAPDGVFMAHKDKQLMANKKMAFPELYQELAKVGELGGMVEYRLLDHGYVGYAEVEPTSKWVVVTSGRQSQVFAPAYEVGLTVLGISCAFLCGIAFVVVRFANGILSSLLSLITYAKRVSDGDFDLKLGAASRNDELGVLHTSLQRLVLALRSMLLETQKASKMKGEFLANMSHEIRTPLNAIIGMSHLVRREQDLSEKVTDFIDKIQLAARSLLGLINDILDLSKVEAGMIELEYIPFNLRELVEDTVSIHQEGAQAKALSLRLEYAADTPCYVIGDPLRIGQVLNNLLSNALKFTREGGIVVRCAPDVAPACGADHVSVRVSVSDTGIGISKDVLATLFQPFTQADASITRQFGGTGLGLAISHKLVQLLGGVFAVESEPGKGTSFAFTMCLTNDPAGEARVAEALPLHTAFEHLQLQGKRILVAEDNAINQMIVEELLAPSGADIVLVDNGQEAVDAVRGGHFDLVLMDLQMPVLDGLEATRRIRTFFSPAELPVIALTANAMREDKERGFASGMNAYITKPIEPNQLLELLKIWIPR